MDSDNKMVCSWHDPLCHDARVWHYYPAEATSANGSNFGESSNLLMKDVQMPISFLSTFSLAGLVLNKSSGEQMAMMVPQKKKKKN